MHIYSPSLFTQETQIEDNKNSIYKTVFIEEALIIANYHYKKNNKILYRDKALRQQ